ncbi:MAG: phosphodiesterase [Bacteroidales bacterium]|nr:phosphodiesterase [Bacteroidales bacterium]
MKYFIVSDIHGSATALEKALSHFYSLKCDMIICLGDILYHGPRNPLPEGYDNKRVCEMLNPLSDKIISCRGNCEAEVCQMVLTFPTMNDYSLIVDNGVKIFATHGHLFSPQTQLPETAFNVFLYGHTHIQHLELDSKNRLICNPGSTTFSKQNSPKGFATYENLKINLYDMEENILHSLTAVDAPHAGGAVPF